MILYSHLKILEKIIFENEYNLEEWEKTYRGTVITDWEFESLDYWAKNYENEEIKHKLLEALEYFKKHID